MNACCTAGAVINSWFINPEKCPTAAQCLSVGDIFHPASDFREVFLRRWIPCSSEWASHRPWMASAAELLAVFHGHQTVAKVSDDERRRLKVTDERGGSGAGVEVGDDVPTGRDSASAPAAPMHACTLFWGKTHVYYFRTLVTAGAFSSCLTSGNRTKAAAGFDGPCRGFKVNSAPLVSSQPPLSYLFITHFPQAWGRRGLVRYSPPHSSHCQNNCVFFSLIRPNFLLVCVFPACIRQLPWPNCEVLTISKTNLQQVAAAPKLLRPSQIDGEQLIREEEIKKYHRGARRTRRETNEGGDKSACGLGKLRSQKN